MNVTILGAADKEADPRSYWVLERAIRKIGMGREQFSFASKPFKSECLIALGNESLAACGIGGPKMGVKHLSGFVLPSEWGPVVPCFEPSYLRQGHMSHLGVLMRVLRLAMKVSASGRQPLTPPVDNPPPGYALYPTLEQAHEFESKAADAKFLAYDIETSHSTNEDEAEEEESQAIKSIQFSAGRESGIFFPWRGAYIDIARRMLLRDGAKLGWNNYRFDNPVLKQHGCSINGDCHDMMWAWHHSQPDLPRGLQFAAAQLGWPWPWKHLSNSHEEFYGIVDVDVLQWMVTR